MSSALNIDTFLPFMRDAARCEASLKELNLMWRLIEASAKMNCPQEARQILAMMSATRQGFQRLEQDLVASLVRESVAEVMAEIGTQARQLIDIVVRNLYERTADVGFLATDSVLRDYMAGPQSLDDRNQVTRRLREYRNKYTVYDEILLVDLHGNVVAQIDEDSPVEGCQDPLLAQTLASSAYVETFRATPLRPHQSKALIYSRSISSAQGQPLGVLCLSFGFMGEMEGIFHAQGRRDGRAIQLLLDADNRVIASADPSWIPLGVMVPTNVQDDQTLFVHGGRAYLISTAVAPGYQGYPGPNGWKGQVMTPVDLAFAAKVHRNIDQLPPEVAQGLLSHAHSFCPPLADIVTAADTIRRVVWNGQVMTAGWQGELQKLRAILEQVADTGARTNELFSQSIRDLYDTVLTSSMRESECLTRLLVDLLDRNLYERADDCRWWAMTPVLGEVLAQGRLQPADSLRLTQVLESIHQLYTVYTRLVVYDRQGRIVASTCPHHEDGRAVLGEFIETDTLAAVRALAHTQAYHVTPFRPSPLYEGQPTYVYHAAIRHPQDASQVVGGIGIVFHAQREFTAMLAGALAGQPGTQAVYVDRQGRVLASTDPDWAVGQRVDCPPELLSLPQGHSASRILLHRGHYTIVGASASCGYREFKVSDGYQDDVLALSFRSFGPVVEGAQDQAARARLVIDAPGTTDTGQEFATFFIGSALYALPATDVQEALPAQALSRVSAQRHPYSLGTVARRREGAVASYVWVFDLGQILTGQPTVLRAHSQILVVRHQDRELGLLVDELQGVPQFDPAALYRLPRLHDGAGALVSHVLKANQGRLLIQRVELAQLVELLGLRDLLPAQGPGADALASLG